MRGRSAATVAAFCFAALYLAAGLNRLPLGDGMLLASEGVNAQDEAVYSHAALAMKRTGDWATPRFLGRYFLYKPPAVYWSSAVSAALFGEEPWALRLPAVLASAAVCALIFGAVFGQWGMLAAAACFAAMLCAPLWDGLARRNLTDPWFVLGSVLAVLHARRPGWLFSAGVALAILAKGAAGAIPAAAAFAFWFCLPREDRPGMRAILISAMRIALIASPWFVYQAAANGRWFAAEFIGVDLLAWGWGSPPQVHTATALRFYPHQLWANAQVLVILGIAGFVTAWWRRDRLALLPLVWLACLAAAVSVYGFRHATYLLPAVPALALLAALCPRPVHIAFLAVAPALLYMGYKARGDDAQPSSAVRSLVAYCSQPVRKPLLVVDLADQFAATALRCPEVRYVLSEAGMPPAGFALDFRRMGIAVLVDEYLNLPQHSARWIAEQRAWGLRDHSSIATVILYRDAAEVRRLLAARPYFTAIGAPAPVMANR